MGCVVLGSCTDDTVGARVETSFRANENGDRIGRPGSGLPSTAITLARGRCAGLDRAAGTLVVSETATPAQQLVAGVGARAVISSVWGALLWHALPRHHAVAWAGWAGSPSRRSISG